MLCSFLLFAVDQGAAATAQQAHLMDTATPVVQAQRPTSLRSDIDRMSARLEAPFASLVGRTDSVWTLRGEETLIALALYGLGASLLLRFTGLRRAR